MLRLKPFLCLTTAMTKTQISQAAWQSDPRIPQAQALLADSQVLTAETLFRAVLKDHPECVPALFALADLALERDNIDLAELQLKKLEKIIPGDPDLLMGMIELRLFRGELAIAEQELETFVTKFPDAAIAWLRLATVREQLGKDDAAMRARGQGIQRAQAHGRWKSLASIEPQFQDEIIGHMERFREQQRDLYQGLLESLQERLGADALMRFEQAIARYLDKAPIAPTDSRQKPGFLFFPDLSNKPIPKLKQASWIKAVTKKLPALQQEAMALLQDPSAWISFFGNPRGQSIQNVLRCDTPSSGCEAAYFFRQGQRVDVLHERCPEISAALASLPVCEIPGQAPEACLSLLHPGTAILPRHGVTNTRLIVQIPLVTNTGAYLSFTGEENQEWSLGTPIIYDDTFEHSEHNESDTPRLSLMVDIWHPGLSDAEKTAITEFVQASQNILK
jgi:aspartate beta-hydroxylase